MCVSGHHDVQDGAWRLHPQVRLRPERFGALAYHFGTRRLNFLRDRDLVRVVEHLGDYPTVDAALAGEEIPEPRRRAFIDALTTLARSEFLEPVAPEAAK